MTTSGDMYYDCPMVADDGTWTVYECDTCAEKHFAVSSYGNFRGWFATVEEVLEITPEFRRAKIAKQLHTRQQAVMEI